MKDGQRERLVKELRGAIADAHATRRKLIVKNRRQVQRITSVRLLEETIKEATEALVPLFIEQGKAMETKLREVSVPTSASELVRLIFNPEEWREEYVNRLLPIFARRMAEAGVIHLLTYGIDVRRKRSSKASTASEWLRENVDDWESLVQSFVSSGLPMGVLTEIPRWMRNGIAKRLKESFSQDYWDEISKTTMGDAEKVLQQGLVEGLSVNKMAKRLREYFEEDGFRYARWRSENIVRTESANALNSARKDSVAKLQKELREKVPMKQVWHSVLGNTTRASHAMLDGVPENNDGLWNLSGYYIPWPGHYSLPPEERCNCQCTLTIEFGMDEEEAQALIEEYWSRLEESEERSMSFWQKYPGQPRDELGRFTSGGGGGGGGGEESRSERAKRTYKPSTRDKQQKARAEQDRLAKELNGYSTPDNLPFDVLLEGHAIEVKTLMDNKNNKVTVHPESRRLKEAYAKKHNVKAHLVAIDIRGGRREYYYRETVGSYTLSNMRKVTISELRKILGVRK